MENHYEHDIIQDFLDGDLSPAELESVRSRIKNDREFAAEVRNRLEDIVALNASFKLQDRLLRRGTEISPQRKNAIQILFQFRYMAAAAIFLLFLAGGAFVAYRIYRGSPAGLYQAYFETPKDYASHGYMGKPGDDGLAGDRTPEELFYYAIFQMEKKNFRVAISALELLLQNPDNLFTEDAEWYLSLCYLRTDRKTEAIRFLRKIMATSKRHSRTAAEILARLH